MKKLIILLFVASSVIGQDTTKSLNSNIVVYADDSNFFKVWTWLDEFIELWDEYAKESIDTIKAIHYAELDFLIQHKNYMESITEGQLERRGYKFKYRWLPTSNLADMKYVFVKEPTIIGFIEYLKRKRGVR